MSSKVFRSISGTQDKYQTASKLSYKRKETFLKSLLSWKKRRRKEKRRKRKRRRKKEKERKKERERKRKRKREREKKGRQKL